MIISHRRKDEEMYVITHSVIERKEFDDTHQDTCKGEEKKGSQYSELSSEKKKKIPWNLSDVTL